MDFFNQIQQEVEEELREVSSLYTDNSSDKELSDQHHYLRKLIEFFEEDTMPYPYPKYNDEADAKAHVHTFLMTWQANDVLQRLSKSDVDKSKIAEFGLSLNAQSVNWYSQHESTSSKKGNH